MSATATKAIQMFALVWLSTASALFGSYTNVVLNDNPVAYWRLGESSGPTAFDETANNNDGTYTNRTGGSVTLGVPGVVTYDPNTAMDVANGGYVNVPNSASLNLTTGMTIEAWANLDSTATFRGLVMKSTSSAWNDGYGIYVNSGNLTFFRNNYVGANTVSTPFATGPNYQHIVGTFDGTDLKLYIDGTLKATKNAPGTISTTANSLLIGMGTPASSTIYPWDGKIDEVAIYNYALSASQVFDHFQAVPEPSVAGLLCVGALLLRKRRASARTRA